MLLHGHTRASLDSLSNRDRIMVFNACQDGLMGPLAMSLNTSRLGSYLHGLKQVVQGIGGSKKRDPWELKKHWPELHEATKKKPKTKARTSQLQHFRSLWKG